MVNGGLELDFHSKIYTLSTESQVLSSCLFSDSCVLGKTNKKKKSALKYGFPRLCLYVPLNTGLDKTVIKVFSKKSIQQTDYTSLTNGSRGLISARIFCRFFLLK